MGRPFDKHIDSDELNALVPSHSDEGQAEDRARAASIRRSERHLAWCAECRTKVSQYRQLVSRSSNIDNLAAGAPQTDCPTDIDWNEVAAGLWPELRAQQLITHAARCAYCGPLLRAATADEPTPQEKEFLAQLKAPTQPVIQAAKPRVALDQYRSIWQRFLDWKVLVPAGALLVLVVVLRAGRPSTSPLSGAELAQFAANAHAHHFQGKLALEVETDSQAQLNQWLHENSQFSLALPSSSEAPEQKLMYRLEGARFVQIRNHTAAYIAYQMQADPVSLIVTPISVAVASGGVEVAFKKVSFHYYTVHDYKVVTWSVHGLTYALVSQEGNKTQRSCMVCHSTMKDRDLSHTPTPLVDRQSITESVSQ